VSVFLLFSICFSRRSKTVNLCISEMAFLSILSHCPRISIYFQFYRKHHIVNPMQLLSLHKCPFLY
jgi:hypothetical protein